MKRTNMWILGLAVVLIAWLSGGCSTPLDDTSTADEIANRPQTINFDDPYGGYNTTDEAPAFGDPVLATDYGPDAVAAYDDPMAGDTDVVNDEARPHRQRFLMITWGNLNADTLIDYVTDWSGGLTVENGAVVLRSTIRFDANDQILPRTSRDKLEWISHTKPSYDGVLVRLHKFAVRDSMRDSTTVDVAAPDTLPLTVTFKTGPLTVTLTEEDLMDLHRVVKVDEAGNAVAFNTIIVEPYACGGGFLAGQWHDVDDRPGGVFRGHWISQNGVHMGYLRGVYGRNSNGANVFFGKWVEKDGQFMGLLVGHWGIFPVDRPGGWFEGIWVDSDLRARGSVRGVWNTSATLNEDTDAHGGNFRGRWRRACRNADTL